MATSGKRSKSGCLTCKARRVKCDETSPKCGQCQKREVECCWVEQSQSPLQIDRKRASLACLACRGRKIRCIPSSDDLVCQRCRTLSIPCSRGGTPSHVVIKSPGLVKRSLQLGESLNDAQAVLQMVESYFKTVHRYAYTGYIHPPRFHKLLASKSSPKELLIMMCACALRYGTKSPSEQTIDKADSWVDQVLNVTGPETNKRSGAVHLMTTLLLHLYESGRGNHISAWLLVGTAVRICQLLCLPTFDETYPPESRSRFPPLCRPESLRRLAWSVFILDSIADGGKYGHHTLTEDIFRVQLPCDDQDFLRDTDKPTTSLNPVVGYEEETKEGIYVGLQGQLVRMYALRRRILHFASKIKHSSSTNLQLQEQLAQIENHMNAYIAATPRDLGYSEDQYYILGDQIISFVLLHVMRHNIYIILGRAKLLLADRDSDAHHTEKAVHRNDRIARSYPTARIIREAMDKDINLDPSIASPVYVALEILLLEPIRLRETNPSINRRSTQICVAVKDLFECLRQQAKRSAVNQVLYIEACHRLIRCDFADFLNQSDWQAFGNEFTSTGQDAAEFDFRDMRFQRRERSQRTGRHIKTAADALMDLGATTSAPPTRIGSPSREPIDASDMISPNAPIETFDWNSFNANTSRPDMIAGPSNVQPAPDFLDFTEFDNIFGLSAEPFQNDLMGLLESGYQTENIGTIFGNWTE